MQDMSELNRYSMGRTNVIPILKKRTHAQGSKSGYNEPHDKMLDMVSIAAHDIRGSAVAAAAALKLINRGFYGKMDERVGLELEKVMKKLSGIIGIVEDTMTRSMYLSGEIDLSDEELDMHADILEPVLNELASEIQDADVVVYSAPKTSPEVQYKVKGHRFLLRAAIRNVLKNAIRYGGKGTRIAVGFKHTETHVVINIFNSGTPVPREYQARLFRKFDRVSPERKSSDGMGLGLYLVKKIILKHGGTIRYEGKPNGSNFIFTLPKNEPNHA